MACAAATVGGGIFNAFAFAGASWIMSNFNHDAYEKEQHRHNEAEEKLQKERMAWEEEETKMKDNLERERIETEEADKDLADSVDALDQYHKLLEQHEEHLKEEPTLDYTPGPVLEKYMTGVKVVMIGGGVYIVSRYIF